MMSSPFGGVLGGQLLREDGEIIRGDATELVAQALLDTVEVVRGMGKRVIIISPTPRSGWNNGQCAITSTFFGASESSCDFPLDTGTEAYDLLRMIEDQVPVYWLHEDICPGGTCREIRDDVFIFRDTGHLSKEGSAYLGRTYGWAERFDAMAN